MDNSGNFLTRRLIPLTGMQGGSVCALSDENVSKVGTIEIVFKYVHDDAVQRMDQGGGSGNLGSGSGFVQANKQVSQVHGCSQQHYGVFPYHKSNRCIQRMLLLRTSRPRQLEMVGKPWRQLAPAR